ncbi:putative Plant UBX domain-containing protein 5 [Cocos nucifera]|uniref:Putative Plant UBX domain-containing protein 5 n=1 Tax=Cocos nucifera TaxID=13894 RepID=A0A8K0II05_COCNU|nr:putative Plant UBX domain-containing protein 5 [Cocos nucifera]
MDMESRSTAEETSLVETFISITSATPEEARFFLESHNWLLNSAIHSFYETSPSSPFDPHPAQPRIGEGGGGEDEDGAGGDDDDDEDYVPENDVPPPVAMPVVRSTGSRGEKRPAAKASGSRSTIRTLADLNRRSGPESDSDSDGPQEYYTGGEKSGMLVQDPSKDGHDVDAIFEQARRMGAMQGPFEPQPASSSRSFTGTGRLLSGETVPSAPQQPQNVIHTIYFWTNGFTVNDGPLRRFDDPENASFLEVP